MSSSSHGKLSYIYRASETLYATDKGSLLVNHCCVFVSIKDHRTYVDLVLAFLISVGKKPLFWTLALCRTSENTTPVEISHVSLCQWRDVHGELTSDGDSHRFSKI